MCDADHLLVETVLSDLTAGTDADNLRTRSEYDDAGQRVSVTDALGRTTRFVYDLAGRLVETVHPDDTAFDDDNPRTRTEYDAVGRKSAEIDELGRRKQYAYDALGRLVAVSLPNPRTGLQDEGALVTRYVYDEAGNKTGQIDVLGRVTRWEYDAMGRQTRRILPGGQSETMAYDVAGQLVARTDFNGSTTRYSYDAAGRLAGTDYATDADVITTYTASGQRESVTDGQGTTLYQYDAMDRLLRVTAPDGAVISYGYDAAGNRTALHSAALDQRFEFDALNRLVAVHSATLGAAERTVAYGYDAVGNRTTLSQADGAVTSTAFDVRNRLRQLLTRSAAGVLLFGATYEVDLAGARTGIAEVDANGPTRSVGYAYDGVRRLTAEAITRPGQPTHLMEYSYDAVGNRLAKSDRGVVTSYVVDDNDRLITETTAGVTTLYTYDANGNTTGQAKPGEWTRYDFDQANRLVKTTTSAGAVITTGYGAEGVRNRESVGGVTTTWLIDANRDYAQTLEAYTGSALKTVWIYGNELLAQSSVQGGGLHERNLHADGMGSVRQATDYAGQLTDGFEYDAFGNQLARTGSTDIDHQYRGEQVDPNTGFYNLRARWYDPSSGRFTSMDSWMGSSNDPVTLHKYLYASDDPANGMDPSGNVTLSDLGASLDIQGILSNIARDQASGFIQDRVFGCPDNDNGQPCLYDIMMGLLVKSIAGAINTPATASVMAFAGAGRKEGHHTVPKYMCGHESQELVDLPVMQHKKVHAELYALKTAVNVGGEVYQLLFRKRYPKELRSPIAETVHRKAGRAAIAAGLNIFYESYGWAGQGNSQHTGLPLGPVAIAEGLRFAGGHYNKGKCPDDDED
ncbi:MAG: RHS repeat-associated core domain-containing protein [Arenimonas sp.]